MKLRKLLWLYVCALLHLVQVDIWPEVNEIVNYFNMSCENVHASHLMHWQYSFPSSNSIEGVRTCLLPINFTCQHTSPLLLHLDCKCLGTDASFPCVITMLGTVAHWFTSGVPQLTKRVQSWEQETKKHCVESSFMTSFLHNKMESNLNSLIHSKYFVF